MQEGKYHIVTMTLVLVILAERSQECEGIYMTASEGCGVTCTSRCSHSDPLQPPLWHHSSLAMTRSTPLY